jgi:hypothetical protein
LIDSYKVLIFKELESVGSLKYFCLGTKTS